MKLVLTFRQDRNFGSIQAAHGWTASEKLNMLQRLIYNIPEQSLKGTLGCFATDCLAGSGGRAGTKTKDATNWFLQNNAFATHIHEGANSFGPLPQGSYYMNVHEKDKNKARLSPFKSNLMFGRDGFLIHGSSHIGSHGCIVPYDFADLSKICDTVEHITEVQSQIPVLKVIAISSNIPEKFDTA